MSLASAQHIFWLFIFFIVVTVIIIIFFTCNIDIHSVNLFYWNIVGLQCCISFRYIAKWFTYTLLSHFSRVQLCATPETAAHQAPPSLGFSRQEHWSGLPFPSPMHKIDNQDSSAGPVAKIPCTHAGGQGLISGQETRFWMPQLKIPCAATTAWGNQINK